MNTTRYQYPGYFEDFQAGIVIAHAQRRVVSPRRLLLRLVNGLDAHSCLAQTRRALGERLQARGACGSD